MPKRRWESQLHYSAITAGKGAVDLSRSLDCIASNMSNMRAIDFDCTHTYSGTHINRGNSSASLYLHNVYAIREQKKWAAEFWTYTMSK